MQNASITGEQKTDFLFGRYMINDTMFSHSSVCKSEYLGKTD